MNSPQSRRARRHLREGMVTRRRSARWAALTRPLVVVAILFATLVSIGGRPPAATAQAAALGISKEASADTVASGDRFSYRLLASCSSSTGDCVDAVVTDVLPPELATGTGDVFLPPLIGATTTYDEATRTVTWTFTSDLGNGQIGMSTGSSVELLLEVNFPSGSTPDGTIAVNQAEFSADTDGDGVIETAPSNESTVAATATFALDLLKEVRGGAANIGLPTTYDIQLCSDPVGVLDMEAGATLQDVLPPGAEFISATNGGTEVSPGVVEWTLDQVPANGQCNVVASVTVLFPVGSFADGDPVTNTASVLDPVPLGGDPNNPEPPIDGSVTHPVQEPFGSGGTTKVGPEWITAGQAMAYTVALASDGFLPITDAVLTDVFPAQVDVQAITLPAGVDEAFYTSDLDATLRPLPFTPDSPVAKTDLVAPGDFIASLEFRAASIDAGVTLAATIDGVVLEGTDRLGGTIVEGADQASGTVITNCSNVTYTDHLGDPQGPAQSCVSTLTKQEFSVPRLLKSAPNPGPFLPGQTASFEVTALNAASASTTVDGLVITDLVPDSYDSGDALGVNYDVGSAAVILAPPGAPPPVIVESVDAASGRTLLEWRWTAVDGTFYALAPGEEITVGYDLTFDNPIPPGRVTNHASLTDWENSPTNPNADRQLIWNCDAPDVVDDDLLAVNGVTLADLQDPEAVNPPCYANAAVEIQAIVGLDTIKWVRGEADLDAVIAAGGDPNDADPEAAGYTRFPRTGVTYPGGYVQYRTVLNNPGNVAIDNIAILDYLPRIDDTGILTGPRGSEWRPVLTGDIAVPPPIDTVAEVFYSIVEDPCFDPRVKVPATCTDWLPDPPDPISLTTAILVDFDDDYVIPAAGSLQFEWTMTAPPGAPDGGEIAWNSFAFSSERADTGGQLLPAEPRKVGIEVGPAPDGVYGDFVWFDFDHDGFQDPEETGPELENQPLRPTGLNDVRVQFYEDLGPAGPGPEDRFVRVTYTADSFAGEPGFYNFPELDPGNYYAVFDVPPGYELTLPNATGDGGALDETDAETDSDAEEATFSFEGDVITGLGGPSTTQVVTPPTALALDEQDYSWDVGFWDPNNIRTSLGDHVFFDNDFSGMQDIVPDGIEGVTVNLYWVGEDGAKADGGGDDVLLQTALTDVDGNYKFDWLIGGPNYYVEFVAPTGTKFTLLGTTPDDTADSDADRTTGFTQLIDLDNGPDPVATGFDPDNEIVEPWWDAGVFYPVSIGDFVFEDVNFDGIQDAGDVPIGGVTVQLYQPGLDGAIGGGDDVLAGTTTTNGAGFYEFTGLDVGDYFVVVTPPPSHQTTMTSIGGDDTVDSDGVQGPVGGDYDGLIVMEQTTLLEVLVGVDGVLNTVDDVPENEPDWDFGLIRLASLGDFIWEDLNADGVQDGGEPGIEGVTIALLDGDGLSVLDDAGAPIVTTTDANGAYLFEDLLPGDYMIRVDPTTAPTAPNRPWFGSPLDAAGDTTDSDVDPDPLSLTFRMTIPTFLQSGENDPSWDGGFWRWASIGDYAWHDLDGDGTQTAGEPPMAGINVALLDGAGDPVLDDAGAPETAVTDANGFYLFDDLPPGTYNVQFDLASAPLVAGGFVATGLNDGTDPAIDSDADRTTGLTVPTELISNEDDLSWDAGFYIPVQLGDFVWYDSNINGISEPTDEDPLNPGPSGINDAVVNLYDAAGALVATTVTADDPDTGLPGWYNFADLRPGTYDVEFVPPTGFALTRQNVGDDLLDSDADRATGRTGDVVLTSGIDDFSWDAGLFVYASIGDFAWDDLNADGVQDAGEPGINGVNVSLLDAAGTVVATTTTAPHPDTGLDGYFLFDILFPETYSLVFDLASPALTGPGYIATFQDQGPDDALDSDADPTTGATIQTVLDLGEEDLTWDAGFYIPVSVGDFVWIDTDGNGIQDAGEVGVPGVGVALLDAAGAPVLDAVGVPITTTTDADGLYLFENLTPGVYAVQFDLATLPTGAVVTFVDQGGDDAVDSDADLATGITAPTPFLQSGAAADLSLDMGIYVPVSVGDLVFVDADGNGVQDAGEVGVPGVSVFLLDDTGTRVTDPAGADLTVVTDADGLYRFTDLPPAAYAVEFDLSTLPADFVVTFVDQGADDLADSDGDPSTGITTVTAPIPSGGEDLSHDLGIFEPVSVGDFVWDDLNGDGLQDAGEPGVPGVVVALLDSTGAPVLDGAGVARTATTDADGLYLFEDLPPGAYAVQFDLATIPAAFVVTVQDAGGDDLLDSDANLLTGLTVPTPFLVSGSAPDLSLDLGLYQPVSVGDFVWDDLDANGVQDGGEPGVAGVVVTLLDAAGVPVPDGGGGALTATTDADGLYLFTDLPPGAYAVQFDLATLPADYVVTFIDQGGDDGADSDADLTTGITAPTPFLQSGAPADLTRDMGVYRPVSLGNFVWDDLDGDGVQLAGEPGINGVTVLLLDDAGVVIASTTTGVDPVGGGDGWYQFADLVPGTYAVQFDLASAALTAPGYVPTLQLQGGDVTLDSDFAIADGTTPTTTLASGETDQTLDGGFFVRVSVGDYVWEDLDGNGIQDAGEPPLAGIGVALLDSTGAPVLDAAGLPLTTVTDADGLYRFAGLSPGIYAVQFDLTTLPADWIVTLRDVDGDVSQTTDSDADPTTGITAPTPFVFSGEVDLTLDMGAVRPVIVGDFVWEDLNGNGLQDPGEPGVAGVGVDLYLVDPLGGPPTLIDSRVTQASGGYLFVDLAPGDYFVSFDVDNLPAPFVQTFQDVGGDDSLDSDADPITGDTPTTGFLESQDVDITLDLGLYQPVSVGDFVWEDIDGNGLQDAGEPVVPGVTVFLLDSTGVRITDDIGVEISTVTDADGLYRFDDLPPASYAVEFDLATIPTDFVATFTDVGVDDLVDSDADRTTGQTTPTALVVSGTTDFSHDLGIFLPVTVGDLVWDDLNGDGLQDVGEPGVEGVTVYLLDDAGVRVLDPAGVEYQAVTDIDGQYLFADLPPGSYAVEFDLATLPAGAIATFPDAGADDGLDSDADRATGITPPTAAIPSQGEDLSHDLGIFTPVTVGDFVWEDLNGDGIQDAGEPGVEGVTAYLLDADGNRILDDAGAEVFVVTDADGAYTFTDLPPGIYAVEFDLTTLPEGFVASFVDVGGDDLLDSDADRTTGVTPFTPFLESGAAPDLSLDLGIFDPVTVGDFVWDDLNGNGIQDPDEPGVEGVAVALYLLDPETGVADPAVDTLISSTTTDADGMYLFSDLDPGAYYVVFDVTTLPGTMVPTFLDQGGDDALDSDADPMTGITRPTPFLESQADDLDLDLGLYTPVSVGDFVWFDTSGDGVQDAGEPGVEGVGVTLFDVGPDGIAGTADDIETAATTTDADGLYLFEDLPPASYAVVFDLATLPENTIVTLIDVGDDDALDSDGDRATGATPATGLVASGTTNTTLDLGIVVPVAIGDFVWQDTDANGIQDADEPGVADVRVVLWEVGPDGVPQTDDDLRVATTTTTDAGEYLFVEQDPGNYVVQFDLTTLPTDFVATFADRGTDDAADSDGDRETGFTSPTGYLDGSGLATTDLTLDLGIYEPVSIGDRVWEDIDGNGIQDDGEPGVGEVTLELFEPGPDGTIGTSDDVTVAQTTTDADGRYSFDDLPPGTYAVGVVTSTLPADAVIVGPMQGDDSTVDSDFDPATGRTGAVDLPIGTDDPTHDAGFFVPYDLRIVKTLLGDLTVNGSTTYEMVVTNDGPGIARGPIIVRDELPDGLVFASGAGSGWTCGTTLQDVACTSQADLEAGASSTLSIVVRVVAGVGGSIVNTASVEGLNPEVMDEDQANNESTVTGTVKPDPATIPRTGSNITRGIPLGLGLMAVGLALWLLARRREVRRHAVER